MKRPFFIVIFLSLALILGAVLVRPKYRDWRLMERRIEEARAEIEGREEYLQNLREIGEILENYQEQLAKIDLALPPDPQLPFLFHSLQEISFRAGVILKKIKPLTTRPSPDLPGLNETEVSLAVSGLYSSFKNFLLALERSARLFRVESISFSSAGEGPKDFHLRVKVYSYEDNHYPHDDHYPYDNHYPHDDHYPY